MKHIASVSFGKDSLAMLLKILQEKLPLDEVVFVDTGMEFQAIYDTEKIVKQILSSANVKYTKLTFDKSFEYYMFEHVKKSGKVGYSWCGGRCRWGTTKKLQVLNKYCQNAYQYVGIAFDEKHRIKDEPNKLYPLIDWEMTEKDCLEFCYKNGFHWRETEYLDKENGWKISIRLYDILDRVSCWCCANKNLKELKNYYKYLPEYWEKLKELQSKTERPYKYGKYKVEDLEEKFKKEETMPKKKKKGCKRA